MVGALWIPLYALIVVVRRDDRIVRRLGASRHNLVDHGSRFEDDVGARDQRISIGDERLNGVWIRVPRTQGRARTHICAARVRSGSPVGSWQSAEMPPTIAPVRGGNAPGRIAGVLCAAALILIAAVRERNASPEELVRSDAPQHGIFAFSLGTCELGPEFCAVTTPRRGHVLRSIWSAPRIDLVSAADRSGQRRNRWGDRGQRLGQMDQATRRPERVSHAETFCANRTARRARPIRRPADDRRDDSQRWPSLHANHRRDGSFVERGSARDHFSGYGVTCWPRRFWPTSSCMRSISASGTREAEFRRVARLGTTAARQQDADRVNLERERLNARAATSSAGGRASLRHCQAEGTLVAHAFLQRERMRPGNDRALTVPGIRAIVQENLHDAPVCSTTGLSQTHPRTAANHLRI